MSAKLLKIGITCYPTLGGSGVIATELGKLLAEAGHEVHFITSSMPFRLNGYNPNIFYHEVEVNQYSVFRYPPYDLTLANKMAQVANRERLDLLHVHYAIPHAICAYLAKQLTAHPLKVITTLHGTDITVLGYDESLKDMIRFGIEKSDSVTAVSEHLIRQTYDLFQVNQPIRKVYNFVDERVYYPQKSAALRGTLADPDEKLVVHISNFRPVKRVADVVKVFQIIARQVRAKLVLIGEGPDFPKACQLLKNSGLEEKVIFLGEQKNIVEILSQTDIMLLPSEQESFGLVALEAMACGVPVVASDAGGLPELIKHEQSGFVYPIGATEEMASAAIRLLQNEEMYRHFSAASIERARTHFNARDILRQYIDIYESVLAET